jgi:GNAT superfamily N-acetyltransferase
MPDELGAVRIELLTGAAIGPVLDDLARLRIKVFREFPYLYDGDLDYETWYLGRFAAAPDALVVGAFVDERLIGAATAVPLVQEHGHFQAPFRAHGIDPATVFYLAESVLLPAWRGRGIGHAFFDAREAAGRRLGFGTAAFCTVVRPADHPLRPGGYRPLDAFWRKRGYLPVEGLTTHFPWKDLGEAAETAKPMQFWSKPLG